MKSRKTKTQYGFNLKKKNETYKITNKIKNICIEERNKLLILEH